MTDASNENVNQLIAKLGSHDAVERGSARLQLAKVGSAAVPPLLAALDHPQQHVRWEAAKTLAAIADPAAAERLVAALADKDSDVRWVVGEALIALGSHAVKPLLTALTGSDLPDGMYRGAHHVLHDLIRRGARGALLEPVRQALDQQEPEIAVPQAAAAALAQI